MLLPTHEAVRLVWVNNHLDRIGGYTDIRFLAVKHTRIMADKESDILSRDCKVRIALFPKLAYNPCKRSGGY